MRAIKLRAHIKETGKVHEVIKIFFDLNSILVKCDKGSTVYQIKEVDLLQYTGLKDKNGKEIYEGDITANEVYKSEGLAFVVYYDNEKGMFKQRPFIFKNNGKKLGNKDLTLQMDSVSNKEVIGNTYENPELLEVTQNE